MNFKATRTKSTVSVAVGLGVFVPVILYALTRPNNIQASPGITRAIAVFLLYYVIPFGLTYLIWSLLHSNPTDKGWGKTTALAAAVFIAVFLVISLFTLFMVRM